MSRGEDLLEEYAILADKMELMRRYKSYGLPCSEIHEAYYKGLAFRREEVDSLLLNNKE